MRDNPLQFAVVREDPRVELAVLERWPRERALLVASGGCTALVLEAALPHLAIDALDPNPAQLAHVAEKSRVLRDRDPARRAARLNLGDDDPRGLSERGNFESLFRGLRGFVHDLVAPREELLAFFERRDLDGEPVDPERWFASRYWPVAFELFLSDALLMAMFGPDAVQHAVPGSYPGYFRTALERGLRAPDGPDDPFLHHLLLGHYLDRDGARPELLARPPAPTPRVRLVQGDLEGVRDFGAHDFVDLSNVPDWMAPDAVERLLVRIARQAAPGTVLLWRQLNNRRNLEALVTKEFAFDPELGRALHARDRSLFYTSVHVGVRRP